MKSLICQVKYPFFISFPIDGYGLTKLDDVREEKLRPGVRILSGRKLSFTLCFRKESPGQHR